MQGYKEIRMFYPLELEPIEDQMKRELSGGWLVVGIRYERCLKDDGVSFTDKAIYILGRKPDDD